jgi:SH3-like domain-containing protein
MLVSLMSAQRTAIVKPGEPREIREKRAAASRVAFLAEPGVVGKLQECDGDWCRLAVGKRAGWIRQSDLFGVAGGEAFGD